MALSLIPNILTGCNLCAGLFAIYFSARGHVAVACWLVIASVIFDGLDGWAARRLKRESRFGMVFDSAADFVSFGIAPAVIYYNNIFPKKEWLVLSALLFYVLVSAFRLIRFTRTGKGVSAQAGNFFEGLPTTASAALLAMAIILLPKNSIEPIFFIAAFVILSVLMLSRFSFRKIN